MRDGRDVARSVVEMGWAGNAWAGCSPWIEAERLWERLSGELPPDRQLSVRFEALITNPVEVLTGICKFCRVAYDEAMARGLGAVTVDGRMIDAASVRILRNVVEKADLIRAGRAGC